MATGGKLLERVALSEEREKLEAHARLGYRPELDGIRAVAILTVVFFHAYARPEGGFLGVDVFFVLSGFLITTLLVQEWQESARISLPHFYLRRGLRLLPALAVALAGYLAYTAATSFLGSTRDVHHFTRALEGSLYSIAYVSNIMLAAGSTAIPVAVQHLWSLATEEQFYVLWPLTLLLALRAGATRRALSIGLTAAIALLFVERLALALTGSSHHRLYYAPDMNFDQLLVGCLAGVWFAYGAVPRVLRSRRVLTVAVPLVLAGLAVMFSVSNIRDETLPKGLLTLFAAGTGLVLLSVVLYPGNPLARVLRLPPLVFVGKISYALYLWHLIIIVGFSRIPVGPGVVLSFVAAVASYYVVELPFLRLKRRDRARVDAGEQAARTPEMPATAA